MSFKENSENSDSLMRRTGNHGQEEELFRAMSGPKLTPRRDRLPSGSFMFEKNHILKGIVKNQKIHRIKDNFIKKISRTSTAHPPVDTENLFENDDSSWLNFEGFEIPALLETVMNLLSVVQVLGLLIAYSLSMAFTELAASEENL